MNHSSTFAVVLVLVAIAGLLIVGYFSFFRKKKTRQGPVEPDMQEVLRIQERLASSRIARRASGSRRKVVAVRPPEPEAKDPEVAPAETELGRQLRTEPGDETLHPSRDVNSESGNLGAH